MQLLLFKICIILCFLLPAQIALTQDEVEPPSFFQPADSFSQKRFNLALSGVAVSATGFSIALYNTWYKQFDRSAFHFFNDGGEWNNMDKAGHIYTAYFQSVLCYKGAKWTGLDENKAILAGSLCGLLFQTTVEVMDGFSKEWGFSWYDFSANTMGIAAFVLQQKMWSDQKIMFKVSSWPKGYSSNPIISVNGDEQTSLAFRADELFGTSYPEKFLKDYNAQTIWISANVKSMFPEAKKIPSWLNVAFGYGSENLFGGFENRWTSDEGGHFDLSEIEYPRYRQYFLSLDIDLTRIKTKSPFLKTLLSILNIFKIPAPAIEYNSLGELQFHFIHL